MQFAVGDLVVHPDYGAGEIVGSERQGTLEDFETSYVIHIAQQGLTLYVPRHRMDELGVRPVMSQAKLAHVLETLRSQPLRLPDDYKERQKQIEEQLKTGRTLPITKAVRDLTWHEQRAHLTKKDSDLLQRGREFLTNEMALATGQDIEAVEETMDVALAIALRRAAN
jgi:CarD family transcriptional regulator